MFNLRHHSYLGIVAAVASLIALVSCSNGSSQAKSAPTATPRATMIVVGAAPVSCVGVYTNASNNYRIACPTGWTIYTTSSLPNGIAFVAPNNAVGLIISPGNGVMATSQGVPFMHTYLSEVGAANVNITKSNYLVKAGANTWTSTTATFKKSGTEYTIEQYVTVHNGKTFLAEVVASTANFSAAQATFQSSLASLNFT